MKKLEGNYQQSTGEKNTVLADIAKIDATLKTIYSQIALRETAKKENSKQVPDQDAVTKSDMEKKHHNAELEKEKEKVYFDKISPAAKEKLANATKTEEAERLKFIEDVERWAKASAKNKTDDQIN